MNQTTNQTKCLGYAYPTSDSAKEMGFYHRGCYIVSLDNPINKRGVSKSTCVRGFASLSEAKAFFMTLPNEISRWSIDYATE